ncbi:hypothetical protein [Methanohalobium sp.]|uniref:DUF7289 family protein n=1 Tax=Methanohalobium sp. TaxID=2837493 RepID=UPI0025DE569D|nr:hypothetical protein [Methanohalobium sp.]
MKSLTNSDTAISTVVSAVLILGLIVTVATIINVSYIPEWKTDTEYSHMTDVLNDMLDLKSSIDLLSTVDSQNTTMSVPVKMGGGEIPIVAPGKSSGTLAVNDYNYYLTVKANNSSGEVYNSSNYLGSISYRSNNNYYVDKVFGYENGALIVAQDNRSIMKLSPQITLQNKGNISLVINAVSIKGDTNTISSNNIEEVQLTSKSSFSHTLYQDSNLKQVSVIVSSAYPGAWEQYFNTTAKSEGLTYNIDYKLKNTNRNTVNFTVLKDPIDLTVTKDSFIARLTPLLNTR